MSVAEKKHYPRALPHRSAADKDAEINLWRSRTYYLLSALAVVLAFAAAVTVFALKKARAAGNPVPSVTENASFEPAPTPMPNDGAPKPVELKKDSVEKERLLEALGSLSAAHLYQCYLNIGLLADNAENEAYTLEEADETLLSIANLLDQVDGQLDKLAKSNLASEDRAAIEQIKASAALLGIQAQLLKQYWLSGEEADAQRYHEARNAAWKGVSKILQASTN